MYMLYAILLAIVALFLFPTPNERSYHWKLALAFLLIFLFGALRVDFSPDYNGYEGIYYKSHYEPSKVTQEAGYVLLNRIMPSYRALLVFQSLLMAVANFMFFKRYVLKQFAVFAFAMLLTLYYGVAGQYNMVRMGMAINLFMFSVPYIVQRRPLPFFALILLGTTIHGSCLAMGIFYFLASPRRVTRRGMAILLAVMVFCTFFLGRVLPLIYELAAVFSPMGKLLAYAGFNPNTTIDFGAMAFITYTFIVISMIMVVLMRPGLGKSETVLLKLTIAYYFIRLIQVVPLAIRFYFFFFPMAIAGTFILFGQMGKRWVRAGYLAANVAFFGYFAYSFASRPIGSSEKRAAQHRSMMEYHSVFDKEYLAERFDLEEYFKFRYE